MIHTDGTPTIANGAGDGNSVGDNPWSGKPGETRQLLRETARRQATRLATQAYAVGLLNEVERALKALGEDEDAYGKPVGKLYELLDKD